MGEAQRAAGAQPRGSKARQSAGEGPQDVALQLKPAGGQSHPREGGSRARWAPAEGMAWEGGIPGGPVSSSE